MGVIIDREIDGATASPVRIDSGDSRLGAIHATVRAARTIFMGSAASTAEQAVRGIDRKRILLGCGLPGQELSFYEDALVKLREQLQYLFTRDERYWYDTRPNLSRTMNEYKSRLTFNEVQGHIESVVRSKWGAPGGIAAVHVFEGHENVPDDIENGVRVVVLPMDYAYCKQTETRTFEITAQNVNTFSPSLVRTVGENARVRGRQIFLAPIGEGKCCGLHPIPGRCIRICSNTSPTQSAIRKRIVSGGTIP